MPHRHHVLGRNQLGGAKQRGVALIFTSFILLGLVAAVGLAIDVGNLYASQQNLQTAANIAAIEAARVVSGCEDGVPDNPQAAAQLAANRSVTRNYSNRGDGDIPTAVVNLGAAQDPDKSGLRVFRVNNALPAPAAGAQPLDNSAVQVVLTDPEPANLFPLFPSTNLKATASALDVPRAAIQVGSSLLTLDNGLLGQLGIDTGVFDQGSLADANITLGGLAVQLGFATPDDLLTTNLPLGDLIEGVNTVADGALAGLDDALSVNLANTQVSLGDIINSVGPLGNAVRVNAQAVASGLIQAAMAVRQDVVNLDLPLNIPGLSSTTARVRILQPPQIGVGRPGRDAQGNFRTFATNAQIAIELNLNLSVLGLVNVLTLPVYIRSGFARADLVNIFCANSQQPFHQVEVDGVSNTAQLGVGRFDNLENAVNPTPDPQSSVTILGINIPITVTPPPLGSDSDTFLFKDPPTPGNQNVATLNGGVDATQFIAGLLTSIQIGSAPSGGGLLGGLLGGVSRILLNSILGALRPLLGAVGNALGALSPVDNLLNNLLSGLGVNLGPAEISLLNTTVNQPELFQATSGDASGTGGGNPSGGGGASGSGGGAGGAG